MKGLIEVRFSDDLFDFFMMEYPLLGIVILQDNQIKFINNKVSEITGYSLEDMKKMTFLEIMNLIHPEDKKIALEQMMKKQKGEGGMNTSYIIKIQTKNKTYKKIEIYSKSIKYLGRSADFITFRDRAEIQEIAEKKPILFENLQKIATMRDISLEDLIIEDMEGLIKSYKERLDSMGLSF